MTKHLITPKINSELYKIIQKTFQEAQNKVLKQKKAKTNEFTSYYLEDLDYFYDSLKYTMKTFFVTKRRNYKDYIVNEKEAIDLNINNIVRFLASHGWKYENSKSSSRWIFTKSYYKKKYILKLALSNFGLSQNYFEHKGYIELADPETGELGNTQIFTPHIYLRDERYLWIISEYIEISNKSFEFIETYWDKNKISEKLKKLKMGDISKYDATGHARRNACIKKHTNKFYILDMGLYSDPWEYYD